MGSNPAPGPSFFFMTPRTYRDFLRKLAAVLLVVSSVTVGIVGLGSVSGGAWWGAGLIAAAPLGIWAATRITPEGGTSGYCDQNL